jgi:truncated hemoglobin YjbI
VVSKNEVALAELFEQGKTIWLRSAHKVTPEIIELLPLLSKKQQLELIENIESIQQEKNEQWLDELKDSPEQRFEDAEDKMEDYIGPLMPVQREYLLDIERQRPTILPLRIEGRKRWLELFSKALFNQPEIDQLTLFSLFTDLSSHRSIEQQNISEQISQLRISELRYIIKSMTDKQQVYLLEKIDDMTADFELLIAQDQIN